MMKAVNLIAIVVISTALTWAQSTAPQTPPAGGQSGTGAGAAQSTPGRGAKGMGGMQQMHAQHMQEMQQMTTQMRQLLDKMKADVPA